MKKPRESRTAAWSPPVIRSAGVSQEALAPESSTRPFAFYHDLQCRSGFGDRLLDLFAAMAIARLHDCKARVGVRWADGLGFQGFVSHYATELFSLSGCEFVTRRPRGAISVEKDFSHTELNQRGIIPLSRHTTQIVLRGGRIWGTNCPDQLHTDLAFYQLDPTIPLERVIDAYREVARGTAPAAKILECVPSDIEGRVGFHIRRGDKLVAEETAIDMSRETWKSIERAGRLAVERCIENGEAIFLCSDDVAYREALLRDIRQRGGNVAIALPTPAHLGQTGYAALVDFFALSRCKRIVQLTKHSTFSLAAALLGDRPLVNLHRDELGVGNRLDIWSSALRRLTRG